MTLRNIEDVEKNLSFRSRLKINHECKNYADDTMMQGIKNKKHELEMKQMKNENEKQLKELEHELEQEKLNIEIQTRKTKGRLEVKKARARCQLIESIEKFAFVLTIIKWFMMIASCFTSAMGFGMYESKLSLIPLLKSIKNGENLNCVVLGLIFLIVQFSISTFVSMHGNINTFFRKCKNDMMFCFLTMIILVVYSMSVYSNYQYWISMTSNPLFAGFYSFVIDAIGFLASHYSTRFKQFDSEKIYEFLDASIGEKNVVNLTTNSRKNVGDERCIHQENKDLYTFPPFEKKVENTTEKQTKKRVGIGKIKNAKELQKVVDELPEGTMITPTTVGMKDNKDSFYKWIEECTGVTKKDGRRYKTDKNTFHLVK